MDADIVSRMKAEEADLSRKLKAVRDFLAAYGEADHSQDAYFDVVPDRSSKERNSVGRPKVGMDGFGDYGRTIVAESMRAMLSAGYPLKTRQIVEHLEGVGVAISGDNKINAVGALLSRSLDITSHGKSGWTVTDGYTALEIVGKYAPKQNAPQEGVEDFPGADVGKEGVPPPTDPERNPFAVRAG